MDDLNTLTIDSPKDLPNSMDLLSMDDDDDEAIDEEFICCVCLDLLYKPIVLACGHISCFWCVHRAMSDVAESHCPICRCPYSHFPAICQLLHFLLLKMYPITYMRRERQVLEEEKRNDCFSPQLCNEILSSHTSVESNVSDSPSTLSDMGSSVDNEVVNNDTYSNGKNIEAAMEVSGTSAADVNHLKQEPHELVSINDVLCVACKQLLFQPSVLNCGHVYCKSCIGTLEEKALRCQLCQSLHPKGFLKVCLELNHLLEKRFPKEYASRREALQIKPFHGQRGEGQEGKQQCSQSPSPQSWNCFSRFGERGSNVHIGVGCDYCGMYPIIGKRYKCRDCFEAIGFDLCGGCYNTRSKLPGRFNQQHTPEHTFDLVKSNLMRSIMRRLVSEHSEDSSFPVLSDDASEDPEDGLPSQDLSDDAPEDQEADIPLTS